MANRTRLWRGGLSAAVGCVLTLVAGWSLAGPDVEPRAGAGIESARRDAVRPRRHARPQRGLPYSFAPIPEVQDSNLRRPEVVATPAGAFDLTRSVDSLPPELRADRRFDRTERRYFFLLLDELGAEPADADRLSFALQGSGARLIEQVKAGGYLVRLDRRSYERVAGRADLLVLEPYHPGFKLVPWIGRLPTTDPVAAVSDVYELDVLLFPDEQAAKVAAAVASLGGSARVVGRDTLRVRLHRSLLAALAALEPVRAVFEHFPLHPLGEETTATIQTGTFGGGTVPYHAAGVDGSGGGIDGSFLGGFPAEPQLLVVLDTGIQLDAADLADTPFDAGTPGPSHRKVRAYLETDIFSGGQGDLRGCDALPTGFTHGHVVAATALGSASDNGIGRIRGRRLDGVAPGAGLVAYDAHVTPPTGLCPDPLFDVLVPGDLYTAPTEGSLYHGYTSFDARTFNLSWGAAANIYSVNSDDVDRFLSDFPEALVFIAAGNSGGDQDNDGVPDSGSLATPATAKNAVTVGATYAPNTTGAENQNDRWEFTSVGPVVNSAVNRTAPILMAPGADVATPSDAREASSCGTRDNDQDNPVDCQLVQGRVGTSYASAAAAGAGLLVRDYFRQGFSPDGTSANVDNPGDQVAEISGALVKALLVASAEFMTGDHLSRDERFNNEQGYGRIQLDNVLPLDGWSASPGGLIVHDLPRVSFLGLPSSVMTGQSHGTAFQVCNEDDELRVALAWTDLPLVSGALRNDLDLTLTSPSGREYHGNYFTDDSNRDGVVDPTEDCPPIGDVVEDGVVNAGPWSLPVCANTGIPGQGEFVQPYDDANPVEAIFLSPDPDDDGRGLEGTCTAGSEANADGPCDNDLDCRVVPTDLGLCINRDAYKQPEAGEWTIEVSAGAAPIVGAQEFAVAIAGGLCLGSTVGFNATRYSCNDLIVVTVGEVFDDGPFPDDPGSFAVSDRTSIEVIDGDPASESFGQVVDVEDSFPFLQPDLRQRKFVSEPIQAAAAPPRDPGNGVLDVRDGDRIRVTYTDVNPFTGLPEVVRTSEASIGCRVEIGFGSVLLSQYGADSAVRIVGGCERDARGLFTFGHPDRYMDPDETVLFEAYFHSEETVDLHNVVAGLRCVETDADSPSDCRPGTTDCDDPDRLNNPSCPWLSVLDTPKVVGDVPAGAPGSAVFVVQLADDGVFGGATPTVEMILSLYSSVSGKTAPGLAVIRQRLNVDEVESLYSTDFPSGGTEIVDLNNTEIPEDPIEELGGIDSLDYRFETRVYGDLTAGGTKNLAIFSPWSFDGNHGGFTSGLAAASDYLAVTDSIVNWGEDLNFNGVEDGVCDSDSSQVCYEFGTNTDPRCGLGGTCLSLEDRGGPTFVRNWNTRGGCGWQSKPDGACTADSNRGCFANTDCAGTCQVVTNPTVSTLDACGVSAGPCPQAKQCSDIAPTPREPCDIDADCGGMPGSCLNVPQTCVGDAGTCSVGAPIDGGIWHTGRIGDVGVGSCDGSQSSQCAYYQVIGGDEDQLIWWELLVTPTIEKVNQDIGPDGLPEARVEIVNWAWNMSLDLPDANAIVTWELDTAAEDASVGADLYGDLTVLGALRGPTGAVTGGQATAIDGYPLFAPMGQCSASMFPCVKDGDCPGVETCDPTPGGLSRNGTIGSNREGDNSCFFEGPGTISAANLDDLVLAGPPDDDQDNDGDFTFDELVGENGPIRNFDISKAGGPDLRYVTLEDLVGEAGNTFQGAIGFMVVEGTPGAEAQVGFGLALDDMVLQWREVTLEQDATDCAFEGSCAIVTLGSDLYYGSESTIPITVVELSPPAANDCDLDGFPDGTDDCNFNAVPDLVLLALSDAEPLGEILYVDETDPGAYTGELPVSATLDIPGVLLVRPSGDGETDVRVRYLDEDDGLGAPCGGFSNPALEGIVEAVATVRVPVGPIVLAGHQLTDNGDGDAFADTNETVQMTITVSNETGIDLTGVRAFLGTQSPEIECVALGEIEVGDLPTGGETTTIDHFTFQVADVERSAVLDEFAATFDVTFTADQIATSRAPQRITLDLDLDVDDLAQLPSDFVEGFEAQVLGPFAIDNIDAGLNDLVSADGFRCQYSDPDYYGSDVYGKPAATTCFPGNSTAHALSTWWQIDGPASGSWDDGRAFAGSYSVYFGSFLPEDFTTPQGVLEALATINPINLGVGAPELGFWQQISLVDERFYPGFEIPAGETLDRAVVQIQVADGAGAPVGEWQTLHPYYNAYDAVATSGVEVCLFDPIDDGTTEDDYDNPTDPLARLGPSSTCAEGFTYAFQGDTVGDFSPSSIGHATRPPLSTEVPNHGAGTWVKTSFDLARYRGQRVRLRFLVSTAKLGHDTYEDAFENNPDPRDDGWWLDEIRVTDTLPLPAARIVDTNPNTGLGNSCAACTSVTVVAQADPPVVAVPGQPVTVSAAASSVDACTDGALQYRFSADAVVRQNWSFDPDHLDTPSSSTEYTVEVRCSSDPFCQDSTLIIVPVLDPNPPRVVLVSPPDGSTDIPIATNVTLTFNVPVDPATIDATTFRLLRAGIPVAASRSVSADGFKATLDPTSPLAADSNFIVDVQGILDLAGQKTILPFTSGFRTGAGDSEEQLPDVSDLAELPPLGLGFLSTSDANNGASVSPAGDLNSDGIQDFVSGAPGLQGTGGETEAGAVLVYFGSADPDERVEPDIVFRGVAAHDRAGVSVAANFDFDADGRGDILIGAEQFNRSGVNDGCLDGQPCGAGKAYLIHFEPGEYDLDANGIPDYAKTCTGDPQVLCTVDAECNDVGGSCVAAGVPMHVSLDDVGTDISGIVFTGVTLGDRAGAAVAGGGRVNVGIDQDILIGAPGFDPLSPARLDAGAAYLIFDLNSQPQAFSGEVSLDDVASASVPAQDQVQGIRYQGAAAGDALGTAVTFPGNVVGVTGGKDDLALGAPLFDPPSMLSPGQTLNDGGGVYIPMGGGVNTGIIESVDIGGVVQGSQIRGSQAGMELGFALAGGGDNLFDGEDDLLIGAPRYDGTAEGLDNGLVIQTPSMIQTGIIESVDIGNAVPGVRYEGAAAGDQLGVAVAGLGDVTGDSIDEIALGAPFSDPGSVADAGTAYFINGFVPAQTTLGTFDVNQIGADIAGTKFVGVEPGEHSGSALAGLGDFSNDDKPDFLVGAPDNDLGLTDSNAGTVYIVQEAQPGQCGSDGCTVIDFKTGARLEVPSGALSSNVTISVKGMLEPTELPVTLPGKSIVGAADFNPDGRTFLTSSTNWVPTRAELERQFSGGELVRLYYQGGTGWVDSTIDALVGANPQIEGRRALEAQVGQLHLYAAMVVDGDGDGYGDVYDCNLSDGDLWDAPDVVQYVRLKQLIGGETEISWIPPEFPGARELKYDVIRSANPSNFVGPAVCVETDTTTESAQDSGTPALLQVWFYLVRAENDCPAEGSLGESSAGAPRVGISCP